MLVAMACGLVVFPPPVRENCRVADFAAGKSQQRLVLRSGEDALAWIHASAAKAMADAKFKIDSRSLEKAVSLLGMAELEELLGNRGYWPGKPGLTEEELQCWQRLLPLRKALLERFAVLDLARGLDQFPSEAGLLLEAAARHDGAAAMATWLAFKEEWGKRTALPSVDHPESTLIAGLDEPEIPLGLNSFGTDEVSARLMKGWTTGDPEAAWSALVTEEGLSYKDWGTLGGLVEGLPADTDWREWATRIGALSWSKPSEEAAWMSWPGPPKVSSALALTRRWVMEDGEAALQWYAERKATWDRIEGYFPANHNPSGLSTGCDPWVPMLIHVYAEWLERQPVEALAYLSEPARAKAEPLAEIVEWTELPADLKMVLTGVIPRGKSRDDTAIYLAKEAIEELRAEGTTPLKRKEDLAALEQIARIEGLSEVALSRIEEMRRGLEE